VYALGGQKGQSLIQVVIALAISCIIFMGMASIQARESLENRALAEKLGALDLFRTTSQYLANSATCS
jgi:Tfp pilus assembly protein PilW